MSETEKKRGQIILSWWGQALGNNPVFDNGAARKARAQLRRATTPSEVLSLDVTYALYEGRSTRHGQAASDGLRQTGIDLSRKDHGPLRLALVAAVIAGLDGTARSSLPHRFGEKDGDNPRLSHLRFQRILRAGDDWTLATRLRRALPLVGRTADVGRLGADLLDWGENIRNRWCFDYFGASPPGQEDTPTVSQQLVEHEEG